MSRIEKTFVGPFAPMLTEFVAQKIAIGYQYMAGYWILHKFDTFSMKYDVVDYALTQEIVEAWGEKQPNEGDVYWSSRIRHLQEFAEFLVGQGYSGYITKTYRAHRSDFKAYVFTHEEMKKIFEAADAMEFTPCSPYKHLSFPLLYRMLYGCGFRISELLNLKLSDVDTEKGWVHILHAKNDNERFVPMSDSLKRHCKEYIKAVHEGHNPGHYFFFKKDGSNYKVHNIEKHFRDMLWFAGIPYRGKKYGPRVHDIRHTFICHRLNAWAKEKADLMTLLPILSKYVGHTGLPSTQWYLKLTAEAFPEVLESMEQLTGHVFPTVGGVDYE